MATVRIDGCNLSVDLMRNERWLGLLPSLRVPLSSIVDVQPVLDGRLALGGIRAPGLGGPRRLIGTWRARRNKQYVCVSRGKPAIVVRLTDQKYQSVIVGVDDAVELANALRLAAEL